MDYQIIKTTYKQVAECHEVKCLCGETYKRHVIAGREVCSNCDVPVTSGKFFYSFVDDWDGLIEHSVAHCPKCGGLAIDGFSDKQQILQKIYVKNQEAV